MKRFLRVGAIAGLLVAISAGASSSSATSAAVQAPPEWAANAGAWPAHNAYSLSSQPASAAKAHAAASAIPVSGKEFSFKLGTKSVGRPGKVTFTFKNNGHVRHDFKIDGKKTPLMAPGKTARLVVTFKKKGKFAYLCTVPGHAMAGMKGVFRVR